MRIGYRIGAYTMVCLLHEVAGDLTEILHFYVPIYLGFCKISISLGSTSNSDILYLTFAGFSLPQIYLHYGVFFDTLLS